MYHPTSKQLASTKNNKGDSNQNHNSSVICNLSLHCEVKPEFLLSITIACDIEIEKMGIKIAFLHGDLEEEIYMR